MIENRPRGRAGYGRDSAAHQFQNDRERIARARQAAEALFAPKPPIAESLSARPGPAAEQALPPPGPVVEAADTTPVPDPAAETPIVPAQPASAAIPASQVARIRTWVKFGMTVREVAKVYGVPAGEIARVLRRG